MHKSKCIKLYNPTKICLIFCCLWILCVIIFILIYKNQYPFNFSSSSSSIHNNIPITHSITNSFLKENPTDNVIGVESLIVCFFF